MSQSEARSPRHVLECELTPEVPDAAVRAAMAAFYKTSDGYARQQGSHGATYFTRLLSVMEAVLVEPNLDILEIGAGAAGAMHTFLSRRKGANAIALELSPTSLQAAREGGAPAQPPRLWR